MFRRSASCSLRGSSWIFLPSAIGSLMFRPTRLKLLWELPKRYQCGGIAVSDDGTDNLSGREDRRRKGRGRRAAPSVIRYRFQAVFQPGKSNQFTFPGAKRLPVTSPACTFEILGITPETDRSGSGCIILIWLHAISSGKRG